MTIDDAFDTVKSLMGITDMAEDDRLLSLLSVAEQEILAWRYGLADEKPTEVPTEYQMVMIYAVVYGFGQAGAEGQSTHSENGVSRTFNYSDMIDYIHRNVPTIVKVI